MTFEKNPIILNSSKFINRISYRDSNPQELRIIRGVLANKIFPRPVTIFIYFKEFFNSYYPQSPIGSMGRLYILPTWMVDIHGIFT